MNLNKPRVIWIGGRQRGWQGGWYFKYRVGQWKLTLIWMDLLSYSLVKDDPWHRTDYDRHKRFDLFQLWRLQVIIGRPIGDKGQAEYEAWARALRAKTRQNHEKVRSRTEALRAELEASTDLKERRELDQKLYSSEKEQEGLKKAREAFEEEHGDVE
jgi:hypothetical protein